MKFTIHTTIGLLVIFCLASSQKTQNRRNNGLINIKAVPKTQNKIGFSSSQSLQSLNQDEIDIEINLNGEITLFSANKKVPTNVGYFHGNSDEKVLNLLAIDENNMFGSIVNTKENTVTQFQPRINGKIEFTTVNVVEFLDIKADENLAVKDNSFHSEISTKGHNSLRRLLQNNEYNDGGDTIDVMVVWTKKAECGNSGLPSSCALSEKTKINMIGRIQLAVEETNTAYALSGISTKLRLVHSYLTPDYVETDFNSALKDITYSNDNKLDEVHEIRAKYGADLVSFWIDSYGCGLGWAGPSKDYMFSVVNWSCATGYFSFGHEIAHNIGCLHDRGTEDRCDDYSIGYGYRDPKAAFRDIMAYNCEANQCDNNAGISCARVQYFSNNYATYNDAPVGDSRNNCAHLINSRRSLIAAYFPSKTDTQIANLLASEREKVSGIQESGPNPNFENNCKITGRCVNNSACCSGRCVNTTCR